MYADAFVEAADSYEMSVVDFGQDDYTMLVQLLFDDDEEGETNLYPNYKELHRTLQHLNDLNMDKHNCNTSTNIRIIVKGNCTRTADTNKFVKSLTNTGNIPFDLDTGPSNVPLQQLTRPFEAIIMGDTTYDWTYARLIPGDFVRIVAVYIGNRSKPNSENSFSLEAYHSYISSCAAGDSCYCVVNDFYMYSKSGPGIIQNVTNDLIQVSLADMTFMISKTLPLSGPCWIFPDQNGAISKADLWKESVHVTGSHMQLCELLDTILFVSDTEALTAGVVKGNWKKSYLGISISNQNQFTPRPLVKKSMYKLYENQTIVWSRVFETMRTAVATKKKTRKLKKRVDFDGDLFTPEQYDKEHQNENNITYQTFSTVIHGKKHWKENGWKTVLYIGDAASEHKAHPVHSGSLLNFFNTTYAYNSPPVWKHQSYDKNPSRRMVELADIYEVLDNNYEVFFADLAKKDSTSDEDEEEYSTHNTHAHNTILMVKLEEAYQGLLPEEIMLTKLRLKTLFDQISSYLWGVCEYFTLNGIRNVKTGILSDEFVIKSWWKYVKPLLYKHAKSIEILRRRVSDTFNVADPYNHFNSNDRHFDKHMERLRKLVDDELNFMSERLFEMFCVIVSGLVTILYDLCSDVSSRFESKLDDSTDTLGTWLTRELLGKHHIIVKSYSKFVSQTWTAVEKLKSDKLEKLNSFVKQVRIENDFTQSEDISRVLITHEEVSHIKKTEESNTKSKPASISSRAQVVIGESYPFITFNGFNTDKNITPNYAHLNLMEVKHNEDLEMEQNSNDGNPDKHIQFLVDVLHFCLTAGKTSKSTATQFKKHILQASHDNVVGLLRTFVKYDIPYILCSRESLPPLANVHVNLRIPDLVKSVICKFCTEINVNASKLQYLYALVKIIQLLLEIDTQNPIFSTTRFQLKSNKNAVLDFCVMMFDRMTQRIEFQDNYTFERLRENVYKHSNNNTKLNDFDTTVDDENAFSWNSFDVSFFGS